MYGAFALLCGGVLTPPLVPAVPVDGVNPLRASAIPSLRGDSFSALPLPRFEADTLNGLRSDASDRYLASFIALVQASGSPRRDTSPSTPSIRSLAV